jgi:hypothetical protein
MPSRLGRPDIVRAGRHDLAITHFLADLSGGQSSSAASLDLSNGIDSRGPEHTYASCTMIKILHSLLRTCMRSKLRKYLKSPHVLTDVEESAFSHPQTVVQAVGPRISIHRRTKCQDFNLASPMDVCSSVQRASLFLCTSLVLAALILLRFGPWPLREVSVPL